MVKPSVSREESDNGEEHVKIGEKDPNLFLIHKIEKQF